MKKIKMKIKNNIIPIMVTFLFFIVSLIIYKNNPFVIKNLKIVGDQFLINFVLIILGFSITLITILYSTFDKLRQQLLEVFKDAISEDELEGIELTMFEIFNQLKEDTLFIFRYLVEVIFILIYKAIDIPYVKWTFYYISKLDMIVLIKLTIIFLTTLALYDIVKSIFKIIEISLGIDMKKKY